MKTLKELKSKNVKSLFLATLLVAGTGMSVAQADNTTTIDTDTILNSEQIDIDGQFRRKKLDAKKLAKMRKKIEKKHEEMIQQKIEDIRLRDELRLGQKLEMAFSGGSQNSDSINMGQAGVAKQSINGLLPSQILDTKKNRVVPSMGMINVNGENTKFDSLNGKVDFETRIKDRFLVGLSVGYADIDIKDVNPKYNTASSFNNFNYFNNFNNGFTNLNTGREMNYKQLDITVNSKFYVLKNQRIKPFVGLGLGYRRATLKYTSANPYFTQVLGQSLEDAEYIGNYVTGEANIGADINITSTIGARLAVNYAKGLTESSQNVSNVNQSQDQYDVDNVGREIEKASMLGVSAGLVIGF